jgi:tetratricopeptide (TPR) repeat protein
LNRWRRGGGRAGGQSLWRSLVAAAVAICLSWGPARAAPTAGDEAKARNHYKEAMTAYELGRFDQAIESFTRAHQLDPAPILLFNIAQSYRKKGDREQALSFYRRYLETNPEPATRARVDAHIRELERPPAAPLSTAPAAPPAAPLSTAPAAPPAALPAAVPTATSQPAVAAARQPIILTAVPPSEDRPLHRRPWFWGTVGAAAVVTLVTAFALRSNRPWNCGMDCRTLQVD